MDVTNPLDEEPKTQKYTELGFKAQSPWLVPLLFTAGRARALWR